MNELTRFKAELTLLPSSIPSLSLSLSQFTPVLTLIIKRAEALLHISVKAAATLVFAMAVFQRFTVVKK